MNRQGWILFSVSLLLILVLIMTAGCMQPPQRERTPVRVLAAGSLLLPLEGVETRFEAQNPDIDVQVEGHGSIQVIRQVTDLHRPVDVIIVADEALIPDMMYRKSEGSAANYTDWYIPFATNSMVIAYTNKSRYADEITPDNWREVLARQDVRIGFSNPLLDAAGYRALMVILLAEDQYNDTTLFDRLVGSQLKPPLVTANENGTRSVTLPAVLKPSGGKLAIRDGSIYLMSLLDAGGIDYAFEYRSVAEGQHVQFIPLPETIDLSSSRYSTHYAGAQVILGFERFSTLGRVRTGNPIVYAITIPNDAPHPELAHAFLNFTLEEAERGGIGWPRQLGSA